MAVGAYKITEKEITNEPIMKVDPNQEEYLKEHAHNRHETYKDFAQDTVEEILEHVV